MRTGPIPVGLVATAMWLCLAACGSCGGGGGTTADDDADDDPVPCGAAPVTHDGEATYYDADGTGNCSFPASPDDLLVAAANDVDYAGAAACGACAEVAGPDGTVTVRVVDRCPGCAEGDLDLSPQAFEQIAPLSAGRVPITWRWVACEVAGPMRYHWKDGTSEFWAAVQVRNHRHAIASLEVAQGGGWVALPREDYNYFVQSGLGPGPLDVRITDVHGLVVEDPGLAIGDDVERSGAAQLPACE
jgi:expansin (peptidoglycan-binding protein)